MPFGFVQIQNLPDFGGKRSIDFFQSFCNVLMDGGFAYSKLLGGLSYGCVVIYDIPSSVHYPFNDIVLQCCTL